MKKLLPWSIHSSRPYFVYDPEGDGFAYFATEEERDKYAKDAIAEYLDDGWMEEVVNVIAGKLTHRATQVDKINRPPDSDFNEEGFDSDGIAWDSEWDYICNYELRPLGEKT